MAATSKRKHPPHLLLRHNTYYVRRRIPSDLIGLYGKDGKQREVVQSLQTSDVKEAVLLRNAALHRLDAQFERRRAEVGLKQRTDRDIFMHVRDQILEEAGDDPSEEDVFEFSKTAYQILRDHEDNIANRVEALSGRDKAKQDALDFVLRGLQAAETGEPRPMVPRAYQPAFSTLAESYREARKEERVAAQTIHEWETTHRLFAGHIDDKPLQDVSRKDVSSFLDSLKKVSSNWRRWRGQSPLSLDQIAAKSEKESGFKLSPATINRHLTALAPVWKWARRRGDVEGNSPFAEQALPTRKRGTAKNHYMHFEIDHLKALFQPLPRRPWLMEISFVALFSGMRLEEITALRWNDIKDVDGVWCFNIAAAKTEAGVRRVPIHSRVLPWVFERIERSSSGFLWPNLPTTGRGKRGAYVSKSFGEYRRRVGLNDPNAGLVFHSFRKTFVRALEHSRVDKDTAALIVGHETGRSFTYGTYNPAGLGPERLREVVELVQFPDLTFTMEDAAKKP